MLVRHLFEVSFARGKRIRHQAQRRRRLCRSPGATGRFCLRVEQLEPRIVLSFNPTGLEQELLQLVNRFRTDPQGELTRLVDRLNPISSPERYIMEELQFWGVSGTALAQQWEDLAPVPPLVWNESLYQSAHAHNAAMIRYDDQQHQFLGEADPGQRMRDEGYSWRRWGENIYAYPRTNLEAHGGFVIDWGSGPYGIQDPPHHRDNLMHPSFQHIGLAVADVGDDPARRVGPLVVTQDLAQPLVARDASVVGAVFKQMDGSPGYRSDGGYGQVTITMEGTGGTFQTTSMSAGGYQLELPPGTYRGFASGGRLPAMLVSNEFVIGTANVAIDFKYPADQAVAPVARADIAALHIATGVVIDVTANDQAMAGTIDASSVFILTQPTHGSLTVWSEESGAFFYRPGDGYRGIDQFEYQVRDTSGVTSNEATVRLLVYDFNDHPWHNPWMAQDADGDGTVSPIDALLVIDDLNTRGSRRLPVPLTDREIPPPLLDVSSDGFVSPLDVLLVIDLLNQAASGEAEGEAEGGLTSHVSLGFRDATMPATRGVVLDRLRPDEWRQFVGPLSAQEWTVDALRTGLPEDWSPSEPIPHTVQTRPGKNSDPTRELFFARWPLAGETGLEEAWWQ